MPRAARALLVMLMLARSTTVAAEDADTATVAADPVSAEAADGDSPDSGGALGQTEWADEPPAARRSGYPRRKKKKKKSWLNMMGMGGASGDDGKPKPVLQKLDLAEVITGCFIVAIGGLFLSFNM